MQAQDSSHLPFTLSSGRYGRTTTKQRGDHARRAYGLRLRVFMIVLLIIWMVLLGVTLVLGAACMQLLRVTSVERVGDRFFLAAWTGLLILAVLLLYWALLAPIGISTGIVLFLCCLSMGILHPAIRQEWSRFRKLFTPARVLIGATIALLVAWAEVQPLSNRDVLIYHLDSIHYLSRTGVVPGLGLVYHRYGFASSWFTIPALFNHGPLTMRIGVVANGFAFLLFLGHLYMAGTRVLSRTSTRTDWFILVALLLSSSIPIFLNYPVSTTPDFCVIVGTMITAWLTLMIYGNRRTGADTWRGLGQHETLLPVLLAACLFTVKPIALPVLAAAGISYLVYHRFRLRAWTISGLVTVAVVLPYLTTLTLITGYPLYPNPWGLDLPWTMPPHRNLAHTRWGMPGMIDAPYLSPAWWSEWIGQATENYVALLLMATSVAVLIWIVFRARHGLRPLWPALLIGLLGLTFMMTKAPSSRFAWAYMTIIPSTLAFLYADTLNRIFARVPGGRARHILPLTLVAGLVIGLSILGKTESEKRLEAAERDGRIQLDRPNILLIPPLPPRVIFDDASRTVNPYTAYEDEEEAYLDSPRAMFNPLIPRPGIRYRKPEKGIHGGFELDPNTTDSTFPASLNPK